MVKEVDGEKGALAALAKLKRNNPKLKTIVSIGGGTGSKEFPALAASRDARETFARQVRQFCDRHEIDGVDSKMTLSTVTGTLLTVFKLIGNIQETPNKAEIM